MSAPERVGPYPIARELGRGGMGVVYEGQHPNLGVPVAIKVLLEIGGDPELVQRFVTEARACAKLNHPGIVRVLDAGQHQGYPYLVMAKIEGDDLQVALRQRGAFPPAEAAALVAAMARAMQHAHERGILHRDLKPSNVLLRGDQPVITDFGLARDEARDRERLTRTGQMLGTPGFMAPEQAAGEVRRVGSPADVYGLGATLFALLTGRPPFVGASLINVLEQVLTKSAPAPSELNAAVDEELDGIVALCLAQDPRDRFTDAGALADALEEYGARGREGSRRPPLALIAGVVLAVLGVGLGVALGSRAEAEPPVEPPADASAPVDPPPASDPADPISAVPAADVEERLRIAYLNFDHDALRAICGELSERPGARADGLRATALHRLGDPTFVEVAESAFGSEPKDGLTWSVGLRLSLRHLTTSADDLNTAAAAMRGRLQEASQSGAEGYWYQLAFVELMLAVAKYGLGDGKSTLQAGEIALGLHPEDPMLMVLAARARFNLALKLENSDRLLSDALTLLNRACDSAPRAAVAVRERSRVRQERHKRLLLAGNVGEARAEKQALLADLERTTALDPRGVDSLLLQAQFRAQDGETDVAFELWEEAGRRAPRSPSVQLGRLQIARMAQRWDLVPERARFLTEVQGLNWKAWYEKAEALLHRSLYRPDRELQAEAVFSAERARELAPNHPWAAAIVGLARRRAKHPRWDRGLPKATEGKSALLWALYAQSVRERKLIPAARVAKRLRVLADAQPEKKGDLEKAVARVNDLIETCSQALQAGLDLDPRSLWIVIEGFALDDLLWFLDRKNYSTMEHRHGALADRVPTEPYGQFRLGWLRKQAVHELRDQVVQVLPKGDRRDARALLEEAKQHYTEAMRLDPGWSSAVGERGYVHQLLEQYPLAVLDYQQCARLDPNDVKVTWLMANVYLKQLGNELRGEQALRETIRRDRNHVEAWAELAKLKVKQGNPAAAATLLDEPIGFLPPGSTFLLRQIRASARANSGDRVGARADLEWCLSKVTDPGERERLEDLLKEWSD